MEKKALGKGLSALIPQTLEEEKVVEVVDVDVTTIKPNRFQPRQRFDQKKLEDLVNSIREKGVVQPIIVRQMLDGYELVAGERRLQAAKLAGHEKIPTIVKDVSNLEAFELALIENIQREDLNIIDQAKAYTRLIHEFNFTQDKIASSIGKDRSSVANILRLLSLPKKIQDYLQDGRITFGHAKAILSLQNESQQIKFADDVIKRGLSVRQAEAFVNKISSRSISRGHKHSGDIANLEDELRKVLGTKVKIIHSKKRGKIVIEYYSLEDLDRILHIIKKR